tara:strand:+ start:4943 stop:5170 length:228 start_codon:yes stop_codon:yes gene_type:complete
LEQSGYKDTAHDITSHLKTLTARGKTRSNEKHNLQIDARQRISKTNKNWQARSWLARKRGERLARRQIRRAGGVK